LSHRLRGYATRLLVERERLPQQCGVLCLRPLRLARRCAGGFRQAQRRRARKDDEDETKPAHRIVSGVPIGISRARRRMSSFRMRMHPCDTRPGRSSGSLVP
jgi:hypothetical protein